MAKAKKTTKTKKATKAAPKKQVINESNSHKALAISFFGIGILCIIFVSLALLPNKPNTDRKDFDALKYDIIIEKHRYEYEGWNPAEIPETGFRCRIGDPGGPTFHREHHPQSAAGAQPLTGLRLSGSSPARRRNCPRR